MTQNGLWLEKRAGGAVGRSVRDPDHLRARADDHTRRGILFAAASSAQRGSSPRRRCRDNLESPCVCSRFASKREIQSRHIGDVPSNCRFRDTVNVF
jgi:hypothetical protein